MTYKYLLKSNKASENICSFTDASICLYCLSSTWWMNRNRTEKSSGAVCLPAHVICTTSSAIKAHWSCSWHFSHFQTHGADSLLVSLQSIWYFTTTFMWCSKLACLCYRCVPPCCIFHELASPLLTVHEELDLKALCYSISRKGGSE